MYRKSTLIYHIPYPSDGERISQDAEARAATIIENALFAGTCGVPDALFEDGQYTLHDMQDGTFTLIVTSSGLYSLCGLANHRLFRTEEPVMFEGLRKGKQYLIYAGYQPELDADPKQFARIATQSIKEGTGFVLLAFVDLMGAEPILDEEPEGKLYSKDVLQHSADMTNPHGRHQVQDQLEVLEALTLKGQPILGGQVIIGNLPGADDSFPFAAGAKVLHVSITPQAPGAGEIWYTVDEEGNGLIFNSGTAGIPFTAEIKLG